MNPATTPRGDRDREIIDKRRRGAVSLREGPPRGRRGVEFVILPVSGKCAAGVVRRGTTLRLTTTVVRDPTGRRRPPNWGAGRRAWSWTMARPSTLRPAAGPPGLTTSSFRESSSVGQAPAATSATTSSSRSVSTFIVGRHDIGPLRAGTRTPPMSRRVHNSATGARRPPATSRTARTRSTGVGVLHPGTRSRPSRTASKTYSSSSKGREHQHLHGGQFRDPPRSGAGPRARRASGHADGP